MQVKETHRTMHLIFITRNTVLPEQQHVDVVLSFQDLDDCLDIWRQIPRGQLNVNGELDGEGTTLHHAAKRGDTVACQAMCKMGVDVNEIDTGENMPILCPEYRYKDGKLNCLYNGEAVVKCIHSLLTVSVHRIYWANVFLI